MSTPTISRLHTSVCILISAWLILSSCQPPDESAQRKEQLKREAFKLQMGMGLTPEDAEGHFQLGKIYHDLGEHDRSIEAFRTAVSLDDENAQTHNHLGLVYLSLRQNDEAVKAFLEAIRVNPDNPTFYNNLGYAYDSEDEFEKAANAYRRAIEIDPEFPDAYYNWQRLITHEESLRLLSRITRGQSVWIRAMRTHSSAWEKHFKIRDN